jgi:asparagine synthase (glutamine-hydrolysing)
MCGIAGFVRKTPGPPDRRRTECVVNAILHRGPDAQGEYADNQVWLGHARLSILDLSVAGNQPMVMPDGNLIGVYNGEVYNFHDLARDLSLSDLRSGSDTEIILRAFGKIRVDSFVRLNGMFALAIYDKTERKLWLVRDRLGIKPLYYKIDEEGLFFGSEIKAITTLLGGDGPSCNLSSLHEWLYYGNALGGNTLYEGIQQIPPGHYLELDLRSFGLRISKYWSLRGQAAIANEVRSSSEMIRETRRLLEAAVHRQLVSDVPVGVFLSGGVDSSAITAIASRHYRGRLATYSAGFDDMDGVDERPKARRVAVHFGTDHHELHISGSDLPDLVVKMVRHHDAPFSDAANIPLYLMAEQISSVTKVVLQGDGGDELFGGYRRYVTLKYRPMFQVMAHVSRPFQQVLLRSFFLRRVARYINAYAADDLATTMALLLTPVDPRSTPEAIFRRPLRELVEKTDPFARYRECQAMFSEHDIGNQMSLVDMMIELPDVFLEKVDRSTMAASLEVRVPFLDHDLVDYVVRIPGNRKMPWGRKKWLLKQALRDLVPRDVLYGPKTGFSVPFGYWLRTSLRPLFFDHLATFEHRRPGLLNHAEIQWRYSVLDRGEPDAANTLWNLLNLMIWCNHTGVRLTGLDRPVGPAMPALAAT